MGFVGARFVQRHVLWIKLQPAFALAPGGDGGTSKEMLLAPGRGCHGGTAMARDRLCAQGTGHKTPRALLEIQ